MANYKLSAQITANISDFVKKLDEASGELKKTSDKMKDIGGKMSIGVTAPIVAAGTASVVMANNFDESMAKISTLYGGVEVGTDNLKNTIMGLSKETGIAANEIAGGYYEALSAGLPVTSDMSDTTTFMTQAIRLAKGGFTDTASAVNVMTSAINAYDLEAKDSQRITDVLITTQNLGKTTVDELSQSMGNVIPTAKAYNVNLEQLGASYALMTAKGINTAESTTSINAMLNELGDTTSTAGAKILELSGSSFSELMASGKSVADVLKIMDDYAKENGVSISTLFGSIEAGKGAMTISGDVSTFNDFLGQMNNSAGATQAAFEKMNGTDSAKFQQALASITNAGIKLAEIVVPVLVKITDKIADMAAKFGEMSPTGQKVVLVLLGIAAAIGPVLSFIGMLIPIIGFFSGAQTANAAATGAAAAATWSFNAAILLIPLAIIAIIAILVLLWKKNEAFRDAVMGVVNAVGGFFQWLGGVIMGAIKAAVDWIMGAFNAFWGFIQPIVTTLGSIFQFVASVIMTAWRVAFTIIQIYIQIWWAVVKFIIDLVASAFKWVADKIWGFIEPVVGWIIEKFQLWWAVTQVMIDLVVGAFNKVKDAIGNAIGSAIETAIGLFNKLKDIVTGVVDSIKNVFSNIGSAISGGINMALDGARSIINKAIGGINSAIWIINAIPGVEVSEIPYLAHGTNNWGGGMAWINEQGRGELVNLPNGAQVIPHDLSKRMIDQYARTSASMQNQTIADDNRTINATSTPVNLYLDSKKVAEGSFDTIYEMLTQRKKVESR